MKTLILTALTALSVSAAQAGTIYLNAPATSLLLTQTCATAHTNTYSLGFDTNGNVSGDVYAWELCGTTRYNRRQYSSYHAVTWSLTGEVLYVGPVVAMPNLTLPTQYDAYSDSTYTLSCGSGCWFAVLQTP
jgi:hypothetical protein